MLERTSRSPSDSRPHQVIYYASRKIIVTSNYVQLVSPPRSMAVGDLSSVARCLTYRYPFCRVACITGGLEVAIGLPIVAAYGSALMFVLSIVSGIGMAVGAYVDACRNPRYMTLEANYRGQRITLFATNDKKDFSHVRLAIIRTIESYRSSQL